MSGNTLPLAPVARSLGKYEVLCRLSTGGMAEIFLASQRGLAGFRKLVVLKQILPDIRGEEEFVRMFLDEAKVTAAFNHPHIAQVYDLDIAAGELFLSMEFVPGATLVEVARACRQANHPIPLGFSLMAVRDTAVALHYAHTFTDPLGRPSPVIHRDVAEKNIMVTYEGVTKLRDFGIAKSLARASRTAVGMVKGTSGYMSPEQVMGEPLDARSDLFSLGVVLHECLTGMRLFYAKQAEAMMNAVLRCEVQPPSRNNKQVPPELDAIVLRALSRRREDRYASTLEFARALERAVGPLIWHPEQSSEVMQRLFADRREQTRQLLMSGSDSNESTAEVNLAAMMALGSVEPSEQPTGGAGLPQAPPPPPAPRPPAPQQAKTAVAKPPTPPQGAPVPRRPTLTAAPATPPAESDTVGTVRTGVMPAAKRAPARTLSTEVARPPPPPAEPASPPPAPSFSPDTMRTQPGRPALMPEQTVRSVMALREAATMPGLPEDPTSRLTPRPPDAPPPPPVEPPRPRPRLTQEGIRTVAAPPPPPPQERDQHTAMVRMPVKPVDAGESSVSVTPPAPRRSQGRRRVSPPPFPPVEPEVTTHTVTALDPDYPGRDDGPASLGDEDPHEHTQRGLQAHRGERRGRTWLVALAAVVLVLGLGSAAVMHGLDGGRVSKWLGPRLAGKAPPAVQPQDPGTPGTPAAQDAADGGTLLVEAPPPTVPPAPGGAPEPAPSAQDELASPEAPPVKKPRLTAKRPQAVRKGPEAPQGAADAGTVAAPPAEPGTLTLRTNPKARVFLGDRLLGLTPLIKLRLPAGEHVLRLEELGRDGKALLLPVDIPSGESVTLDTPLAMLSEE
ncbi:MAG TPA: serine/threonine-protein kinase [Myxococcus sp.]|nr:serine/threonine-protein kinase [Myxococcus sp.]